MVGVHISVCICTFKRPQLLERLLRELATQKTDGLFTFSIVVVDNDESRSAERVVATFEAGSGIPTTYCVEPRQNISLARNRSISCASGNYIAFIDDDEFPIDTWLLSLFKVCQQYNVDGVLGPVKRYFDTPPPKWLLRSNFYERPVHPTGLALDKELGRTGNVLLKKEVFDGQERPFNPEFRGGGDKEFFRRMINTGCRFIWSAEAVVFEVVPPVRWKRSFMLKRALFRGALVPLHPTFGWHQVVKSFFALVAYTLLLPIALILGQHRFMTLMVKLCDHLGLLLAVVGISPLDQAYITE